jgi:uncharacterized Fe-S cluster-containing radical SAM superfamily protein
MQHKNIDTDMFSSSLRSKSIDVPEKRLLMTKFGGTEQEQDLTEPPNCDGFGRIRHFKRLVTDNWPNNPLPIDPACKALGLPRADILRVQAFQNAACNWRCWYCYVPFSLLAANPKYSEWVTTEQLIEFYSRQNERPPMIDLTGGQPDLVPEWVLWTMNSLKQCGLDSQVYLWSDDNLSNDYFWQFLTDRDREAVANYPNYGRVCCFKGFNNQSFSFNTRAEPELYDRQFELMGRLLGTGIDLYAYVTFTTPSSAGIADDMPRFVDRLQELDINLPLRTIPIEIREYTPMKSRNNNDHEAAMRNQSIAVESWSAELSERFTACEMAANITDVRVGKSRPK